MLFYIALNTRKIICIFTDAPKRFWSGIATQTTVNVLQKPEKDQINELLTLGGGSFKKG